MPLMDVNWLDTELIKLSPVTVKGVGPSSAPTEKVIRNIDESHFGPDSVGKINVAYQNAKRTKSKGSIKGKVFLCVDVYMNSFIH
jgi:hypothetical protein